MIYLKDVNKEELNDFLEKLQDVAQNYSFRDQLDGVVLDDDILEIPIDCNQDCPDDTWRKKKKVGPGGIEKCVCVKISNS